MATRKIFPVTLLALPGLVAPSVTFAAGDGGKIFSEVCTVCHTAKRQPLDKTRLTRDGWNEVIERMVSYGTEIPKGKLPELLDYLVSTHGPAGTADEYKK